MVYRGPSTGCGTCRHRRVKCDEAKPQCHNCQKRSIVCTGYGRFFDRVHRDQNSNVRRKAKKLDLSRKVDASLVYYSTHAETDADERVVTDSRSERSRDEIDQTMRELITDRRVLAVISTIPRHVSRVFETESTDMFLHMYCGMKPSPRASGGMMHHLRPLLSKTPLSSPLHKAVAAVAVNMAVLFSTNAKHAPIHRQYYATAVNSLRKTLNDPDRCRDDDVLMSALVLDLCDALNAHLRGDPEAKQRSHQTGAVALVKHRGSENFKNDASKAMVSTLQHGVIHSALQMDRAVPVDSRPLFQHPNMPQTFGRQLDALALPLTDLLSRGRAILESVLDGDLPKSSTLSLFNELHALDRCYVSWKTGLPTDYEPRLLWGEQIPASVRRAGVYRDQCTVYADLSTAQMSNLWCMRRIRLLHALRQCALALQDDQHSSDPFITSEIDQTIQSLVDGVCDSVPFFLGDSSGRIPPLHRSTICFPFHQDQHGTVPEDPKHHAWYVTCAGEWLMLTPLVNLLSLCDPQAYNQPLVLRAGQQQWIASQLDRLGRAWDLPRDPWPTNTRECLAAKKCVRISMAHNL